MTAQTRWLVLDSPLVVTSTLASLAKIIHDRMPNPSVHKRVRVHHLVDGEVVTELWVMHTPDGWVLNPGRGGQDPPVWLNVLRQLLVQRTRERRS